MAGHRQRHLNSRGMRRHHIAQFLLTGKSVSEAEADRVRMKSFFSFGFLIVALSAMQCAVAGQMLDYIRNYDLNDYAFGVSFSSSQNPYVGGENNVFAYPYLTSFRDAAFTDDWLVLREGDIGVRWVSKTGLQLGLVGRLQTLGFGNSEAPVLRGVASPKWTIELAPTIGWRAWPVHIDFKAYTEVMGRHDGWASQLSFSLPYENSRGYIVPSVRLIRQSEDYTNYYYGVAPSEERPARPAYQPGEAMNTAINVRFGYELSEKWLLSGHVGIEYLDSEISNSPIVDEESIWSASLGLAYNSDIFQPRDSGGQRWEQPPFEIKIAAFNDSIDTKIVHDTADGVEGSEIDLEDLLGMPDEETVMQLDAIFRVGQYHRLEFGYFELSRNGLATLEEPINIGDVEFPAGTEVRSGFDTKITRLSYAYTLMKDEQKELGVMAGVHYSRFKTEISATETDQRVSSNAVAPLPVIGVHGLLALGQKFSLGAKIQLFRLRFDRYKGSLNYLTLDLQRPIGDTFSLGVSYTYYTVNLDSSDDDLRGSLKVTHQGPALFINAAF